MKKSIKLTLGLLGISAISAITVGSVISCSNDSSMVSTNSNNSSNSNNTNKSNTSNKENTTNFIPYSELTKTVTKEPSFAAALANWTNYWNKLTANPETYLNLITNDVNSCLNYSSELINKNPLISFGGDGQTNVTCTEKCNDVNISLNKNNTFNISFSFTSYIGYMENNKINPGFELTLNLDYSNVKFMPYLLSKCTFAHSSNNQIVYGGEFMSTFTLNVQPSISKLIISSNNSETRSLKQVYSFFNKNDLFSSSDKSYSFDAPTQSLPSNIICLGIPVAHLGQFIDSFNNGMNFGKLTIPNNN